MFTKPLSISTIGRSCAALPGRVQMLTPRDPALRGAQLSLVLPGASRDVEQKLHQRGVVVDFREPNVIRAAPVPLYNTFHDVWRFVHVLDAIMRG